MKCLFTHPLAVCMFFICLTIVSLISINYISFNDLPDINLPRLTVICSYSGLPAEEVRIMVSKPLEESLSSLSGLKDITSISRDGLSIISLQFHWGSNMKQIQLETREVIDLAYIKLPSDAEKPQVLNIAPTDNPIMSIGIFPKQGTVDDSLVHIRRIADRDIKSRLQQVFGTAGIQLSGGRTEEIHIEIDRQLTEAKKISLVSITEAIAAANVDCPAGTLIQGKLEYIVKTKGKVDSWTELRDIPIALPIGSNSDARVTLGDISKISRGFAEQHSLFQYDGNNGVLLEIRKQNGCNPLEVAKNLREEVEKLRKTYTQLGFVIIQDASIGIQDAINSIFSAGLLGVAIAFLIVFIFLKRINRSLILLLVLIISVLSSVLFLFVSGKSINNMTLGGLALAIGMLIDNGIVVLEFLDTHNSLNKSPDAMSASMRRIAPSLIGSTITSLVVFIPLLYLPGVFGLLYSDLALAVIFVLSTSLIISLSLLPVLFTFLPNECQINNSLRPLEALYIRLLKKCINNPIPSLIFLAFITISGVWGLGQIPIELLPDHATEVLEARLQLPTGTSMKKIEETARNISEQIKKMAPIKSVSAIAGGETKDPYYLTSFDRNKSTLKFTINVTQDADVVNIINVLGQILEIHAPASTVEKLLGLDISVQKYFIANNSLEQLEANIQALSTSYRMAPSEFIPRMIMTPDRIAIVAKKVKSHEINANISNALFGKVAFSLNEKGIQTPVRVRLDEKSRSNKQTLYDLSVPSPGGMVRVGDISSLEKQYKLSYLIRKNHRDIAIIYSNEPNVIPQIRSMVSNDTQLSKSPSALTPKNANTILMIFTLAVIFLYLVLGSQFESFTLPIVLLLSIPLSTAGISIALWISGTSFNLNSIMGVLVLMGISVNNSIILIEQFKEDQQRISISFILKGSKKRFKPIIMTMLTTVLSLIPLVILKSSQSDMAIAIIGGLIVSTFLTIFLIPIAFIKLKLT